MFDNLRGTKVAVSRIGNTVVKASGDAQPFDPNIITTECVEAGIEFWTAAEVAMEVSKRIHDKISAGDVQTMVLELLLKKNPEVAERYKRFHSMHVRTSKNTIEAFNRKNIISSLILETGLPKELSENVAKETEEELRKLKLDFVSAPLIREIINVKLLEHGYERARADYTRLGIPVFDATLLVESGSKGRAGLQRNPETIHKLMADQVFKEYSLLKVLPLHLSDAHMWGEIHIHDLDYFATRPYCAQHDLRWFLSNGLKVDGTGENTSVAGPAKNPEVAILHASKALAGAQTNFAGGQGLDFFNVWLAPYMRGLKYPRIKQLAQMFIYDMSQMYVARGGQMALSDIAIEYGCPSIAMDIPAVLPGGKTEEGTTYGDFDEEARLLGRALTEVYLKGDHAKKPFFLPKPNYKLRKEDMKKEGYDDFMILVHKTVEKYGMPYFINLHADYLPKNVFAQSCGHMLQHDSSDFEDLTNGTMRTGILQVVTLNLPRISYESSGDDSKFYEILDDRLRFAKEVIMIKREVIGRRLKEGLLPFLTQDANGEPYYRLDRMVNSIGYTGVNEMVQAFTGKEMHKDNDSWKFGLEVIKYMSDTTARWSDETGMRWALTQTLSDSTSSRLAKLDYGRFPGRAIVRGDVDLGSIYYTNSAHVRGDAKVPLMRRLELEGAFHPLSTGGMMAQVRIDESCPDSETLWELTKEISKNTLVGYWRYTGGLYENC